MILSCSDGASKYCWSERPASRLRAASRPGLRRLSDLVGLLMAVHGHDQSACRPAGGVTQGQEPVVRPDEIRQDPQPQEVFDENDGNENDFLTAGTRQRPPQGEIPFAATNSQVKHYRREEAHSHPPSRRPLGRLCSALYSCYQYTTTRPESQGHGRRILSAA